MCWFFIVIKFLILKILLTGLTGLITASRYDYGYHASAEEFDNLLHETHRTWTHNFLKAERHNGLMNITPVYKQDNLRKQGKFESKHFVPKFQYKNEQNKFSQLSHNLASELQVASSNNRHKLPFQNIGSSSDFNYFSEKLSKPIFNSHKGNEQPNTTLKPSVVTRPISPALPLINLKPIAKPVNLKYKNTNQDRFPIYFTNPATGIVYAITEVGNTVENFTKTNGSIPIFITKEQYERDINQLKQKFEQNCSNTMSMNMFSTSTITSHPQIIKIQKKLPSPVLPIETTKFTLPPTPPLKKPTPVMVQTKLIVKDKKPTTVRPFRKRKNKSKTKRKLKKHNAPGHKPSGITLSSILENSQRPIIIMRSRATTKQKSLANNDKLSTQLEKPNFYNVFSSIEVPQVQGDGNMGSLKPNRFLLHNHKVNKRSIQGNSENSEHFRKSVIRNSDSDNLGTFETISEPPQISQISKDKEKEINIFKIIENPLKNFTPNKTGDNIYEIKKLNYFETDRNLKVLLSPQIKMGIQKENSSRKIVENLLENPTKNYFEFKENDTFDPFQTNGNLKVLRNPLRAGTHKESNDIKMTGSAYRKSNKFPIIMTDKLLKTTNDSKKLKNLFENKNYHNNSTRFENNFVNLTNTFAKVNNISGEVKDFECSEANKILRRFSENKINFLFNRNDLKNFITNNFKIKKNNTFEFNLIESVQKEFQNSAEQKKDYQIDNSFIKIAKELSTIQNGHRINKRSVNFPKFIKKSNTTINQILLNNTTGLVHDSATRVSSKQRFHSGTNNSIEIQQTNKTDEFLKNSKLERVSKGDQHFRKHQRQSQRKSNKNKKTYHASNPKSGTIKENPKVRKTKRKSNIQQDTEYYFFNTENNYDDDYEDDDDDDDEEGEDDEEVEEDNPNENLDYNDDNDEVSVSLEDFNKKPAQEIKSSTEDKNTYGASLSVETLGAVPPPAHLSYDNNSKLKLKTKSTLYKKRISRRPPQLTIDVDDYEEEDEEDNSINSNLSRFFHMIFYPIHVVITSVMDSIGGKDAENEEDNITLNPHTQYTSYHNTLKQHSNDEYDEDYDSNESIGSFLSSWFNSWFNFNRRNKKIDSTTVAPLQPQPIKSTSWLPSWLNFGANDRISTGTTSNEDYDEYDKWFASWFGEIKPKTRKRTTTTTTTTTQIPHVPILTIVDPMKNPQNWIGILAHHIINHTSTSTANPLKDMWPKVTSTTTEDPEIPKKISYERYQIWRLKPQDDTQVKALEEYKKSKDGIKLQWLKGPSLRGLTDVLVPPKMLVDFQASITFELIDHEVLIFDVGKAIAYEKSKENYFLTTTQNPKKQHNKSHTAIPGMTWHKYYEYDDIIKYLERMRIRFPNLVELIHIGRSYEGRPLIIMKIESKEAAAVNSDHYSTHQHNKLRHKKHIGLANAVFIEAGTHGMEWIGPTTATWIINELLRIMKKNVSDDQSFLRNTTWYIMPVLNPDGYVYSHEYDRFWKKSRSRHISRSSGILNSAMTWLQKKRTKEKVCFGVDLNRNWHYQWGRRGSSKSPCNEFYAGSAPFSEPETKALSEFLKDYRTQIKLFISMQSYGQIISYPYKANTTYDLERLDDLLDVAMVGTDGLRKKGSKTRYKIDSSNDLIESRSGCSDAFAAYEVGIPFSYTLQLADNGVHGYLLPSALIESTAKDSFDIITGMLEYI